MALLIPFFWPDLPKGVASEEDTTVAIAAPAPEGSQHVQVQEHRVRGYRVTEVVVGRAHMDDELPMVVLFHGRGDQPELPQGNHAESMPMRLMFPWAPDRLGDGRTWFPISITAGRDKVLGHHIRRRAAVVARLVDRLAELRPTEGKPLVTGFSQGGMLSFALAVLHPETVDSAYPVSGWLPDMLLDEAPGDEALHPQIRAVHGDADPIVPVQPTQSLVDSLRERGIDARIEAFEADEHRVTRDMRARYRQLIFERIRARRAAARNFG